MKILIIGNLGFVGSHLTKYLNEKKIDWVGYDLQAGQDIRCLHQLDNFFEINQITDVIHLAALAGVRRGEEYPEEYISTNIVGMNNVVKMCEKYNIKHLVSYSSSSVYGDTNPPISESFVKKPKSIYGITKLAAELIVQNSNIKQTTILIPFTIYGGENETGCRKDSVIHKWIGQAKAGIPITQFGNGNSQRGYVYIQDIVEITYRILTECIDKWKHNIFNVGGSEVISLKKMVKIFKDNIKDLQIEELNMPDVDIFKNYADTSKISKELNWYPEKNFEKNLKKIIKNEIK